MGPRRKHWGGTRLGLHCAGRPAVGAGTRDVKPTQLCQWPHGGGVCRSRDPSTELTFGWPLWLAAAEARSGSRTADHARARRVRSST